MECRNCEGAEWVCENHRDLPWEGCSISLIACSCGAGAPCPVCNAEMACAGYVWAEREKALTPAQIRFILSKLGHGDFSSIGPDPSFTGQDALALAERLKERLSEAEK